MMETNPTKTPSEAIQPKSDWISKSRLMTTNIQKRSNRAYGKSKRIKMLYKDKHRLMHLAICTSSEMVLSNTDPRTDATDVGTRVVKSHGKLDTMLRAESA